MLSIGAMGSGQGAYYTGLAREDYYLEGGDDQMSLLLDDASPPFPGDGR